jgi:hypothetical protein
MVVYAENVFNHKLGYKDVMNLSLNISMLSVFYAFLGAGVSFAFHYLFDDYDDEWKKKSLAFKIYDISVEIALLALIAFWSVFYINTSAPIFPVRKYMAPFVDTYTSGMFFIYAIFLFLDDLGDKLKFLYETYLQDPFKSIFPTLGSILDLSLRYETTKTESE